MDTKVIITVLVIFVASVTGQTCRDKDSDVCKILAKSNPDLCADSCLSSICTRFCGKCPLECYTCHEIDNPVNCTTLSVCPSNDHFCYTTQTFNDDFKEVYNLGCAKKEICEINIANGGSSKLLTFGSKRSDLSVKGACCTNDRCNNNLPTVLDLMPQRTTVTPLNTTAWPMTYTVCNNMDDDVCLRLSLVDPLFCSNDCIANKICPRMCRKCFQCYNCNDLDRPEQCNSTTTCQTGKECFQLETLSIDLRPVYRLGCLDQSLCQRFGVSTGFGRRQQSLSLKGGCCITDLCNKNLQQNTQIITTTPAPPQTTTTAIDCRQPTTDRRCPPNYTYVFQENACFVIGDTPGTWNEGQEFCRQRCGSLANFPDYKNLVYVFDHIGNQYKDSNLWIGANKDSHSHQWIWADKNQHIDSTITFYLSRSSYSCAAGHYYPSSPNRIVPYDCNQRLLPLCKANRL